MATVPMKDSKARLKQLLMIEPEDRTWNDIEDLVELLSEIRFLD
jgi:hypothetical protein